MPTATIHSKKAGSSTNLENDAQALLARMHELESQVHNSNDAERRRLARDLAVIERVIGRPLAKHSKTS